VVAAKYEYPGLTSVHLEPAHMGELAAETILKLASGEQMAKREIILEGHLIIRQSCGCNINKGKIK
ncbi:MAG: Periplasmic binding protein-like domain, partial [Actinomycetota bacterium]